MKRSSFTLNVVPSSSDDTKVMVYCTHMQIEDGKWGSATYLLDENMVADVNGIPETAVSWAAIDVLQRALRVMVARYQEQHDRA